MNGWRLTEKELPKEDAEVLCWWGNHVPMDVGFYAGGDVWTRAGYDMGEYDCIPTHWMALPDAPVM